MLRAPQVARSKFNLILLLGFFILGTFLVAWSASLIFHQIIFAGSQPSTQFQQNPSAMYQVLSSAAQPALSVSPSSGPAGTNIELTGQGFPPGATIDLFWSTVNGSWVVQGHDFLGSKLIPTQQRLSPVQTNLAGQFNTTLKVPYDYGTKHNILATVRTANSSAAKISAQAIFNLIPSFQISSKSGPSGTHITIKAAGLGWGLYSTDYHVLWDNNYAGYITGISTMGNATFTITAVGSVGEHYIDIYEGYPGPAYLNIQQSPPSAQYNSPPLIPFHAVFTITPSSNQPDQSAASVLAGVSLLTILGGVIASASLTVVGRGSMRRVSTKITLALVVVAMLLGGTSIYLTAFPTTSSAQADTSSYVVQPPINVTQAIDASGIVLNNQSTSGNLAATPSIVTVGRQLLISGSGLAPNANLQIEWSTMVGSYLRGWNTTLRPLENVKTDAQGGFSSSITVPHDLEGIHEIKIANISSSATAFVYIVRSAMISPTSGPAGTIIQINMTGVGWTFATNTATIVYDNSYVGYVCGFNSNGDVTAWVKAVGTPGIHTIDIYPTIYMGPNNTNAEYRYPLLDPQDHPAHSASFHFEFVITGQQQTSNGLASPLDIGAMTVIFGLAFLIVQSPIVAKREPVTSRI